MPNTFDSRFNMRSIMGVVDGTTGADEISRPGQRVYLVDALSQRYQELLNNIRYWTEITWRGEKLTTLCWRLHGVDSTDNIVLAFNGLGTMMELRPGMVLRIPLRSELDRLLLTETRKPGVAGQKITI